MGLSSFIGQMEWDERPRKKVKDNNLPDGSKIMEDYVFHYPKTKNGGE
jgi:hypothetical protein